MKYLSFLAICLLTTISFAQTVNTSKVAQFKKIQNKVFPSLQIEAIQSEGALEGVYVIGENGRISAGEGYQMYENAEGGTIVVPDGYSLDDIANIPQVGGGSIAVTCMCKTQSDDDCSWIKVPGQTRPKCNQPSGERCPCGEYTVKTGKRGKKKIDPYDPPKK